MKSLLFHPPRAGVKDYYQLIWTTIHFFDSLRSVRFTDMSIISCGRLKK
ncbi:MAG: hypothetical protein LBR79_05935 [Oscillospiraceae bacterium]|nr:hypothetical protein [Oscillospiraceae bacterium]